MHYPFFAMLEQGQVVKTTNKITNMNMKGGVPSCEMGQPLNNLFLLL